MANYKSRFDEQSAPAIAALAAKSSEFRSSFLNFDIGYVRRLIERISAALQKIDDAKVNHPMFLAGKGYLLPDRAISLIASVPTSVNDSGMTHFVNNVLPDLVEIDEGLAKAIGVNEIRSAEIKSSQLRAIEKYVDWSKISYTSAHNSNRNIGQILEESKKIKGELDLLVSGSQENERKIREVRATVSRLKDGTKTTPALSAIFKGATENLSSIEQRKSDADRAFNSLKALEASISDAEVRANDTMLRLEGHEVRAGDILSNATQAGLAGAFKIEREKLASQQFYFALAFYGIILSVILYAAIFIVPIASDIIINRQNAQVTLGESGLLLFVRILIASPAIWALIFTNKRFIYLETLQMDYAAKAVTALAYSGYRDEMEDDSRLSTRLRDGLVTRFVEHPSRLLGKKVESSISITGETGSKVVTETHSPETEAIALPSEVRESLA